MLLIIEKFLLRMKIILITLHITGIKSLDIGNVEGKSDVTNMLSVKTN